jgi:hypothetical protein
MLAFFLLQVSLSTGCPTTLGIIKTCWANPPMKSFGLNVLKIKFFDIEFHFFSFKPFFKLTRELRFGGFFTMNPMCYGTPCTYVYTNLEV